MTTAEQPDNVRPLVPKQTASIVYVTPEMATRWLHLNTHNRSLNPPTVRRFVADMRAGAWQMTGEAIKFAPDGALLDGQHRLSAIVQSGVTVPIWVMRNVDPAAQRVMDTGRRRSAGDALTLAGEKHATMLAAACRVAIGMAGDGTTTKDPARNDVSHAQIEAFVAENPDIRSAVEFAARYHHNTDCLPALVSYSYWVMARINYHDADSFWRAASLKVGLVEDDPVLALTNRLAQARRQREQLPKRALLSMVFRAWNARRAGKPMRIMRVNGSSGDIIPIPDLR